MRIKVQIFIIILLVLTGIGFLVGNSLKKERTEILEEIKIPVIVTKPEHRTLEKKISFRGFVESNHTVDVYPQAMGVVQSIKVEEGQRVRAGQLIAVLDSETARHNLKQAEAAYILAVKDLNRYKVMYAKSLISQQQYQNIETNFKAKQAQYALAKVQYEYSQVKSPLDGIVQRIHVDPGVLVSSQVNLMSISARGTNIIKVDVPEKYYEFFYKNKDLPIEVIRPDNPSILFPGRLQYVSPFISPGTMKFQVTIEMKDQGILIPGMYVEVGFILDRKENLLSLPYKALTRKAELWWVDENEKVYSFIPENIFQGDNYFAIDETMSKKRFIIEGQHFLKQGQEIRILNRGNDQ